MKRKEMINSLWKGKYKNDIANYIQVSSNWVKENDKWIYVFLLDMLKNFANDKTNKINKEDVKAFKSGEWIIEYYFEKDGVSYIAGRNRQNIANQNRWFTDNWEDVPTEKIKLYYEQLSKKEN